MATQDDGTAPVVTIDGPSGSGKGTISQRLADRLGWHYLDSGALYRLTALAADRHGVALDDVARLARLAASLDVRFEVAGDGERIFLDGAEVGPELRSEVTGDGASRVAALPEVRAALLARQRAFRLPPGLVADGRDMGTVVFPDAEVKIFLTASSAARAERRYKQLKEKGIAANLADLSADLAERDRRDSERAAAPLKPAVDAVIVDSTELDILACLDHCQEIVRRRLP
ncbi:MAG: (d)CMP kinase [Gammaproteobacteria bacterium]|nr:(d)CMP kinase [Gammaproteobacteria bacterium]